MSKSACFMLSAAFILMLTGDTAAGVRKPAVAGTFYPSDSAELSRMVDGHLVAAGEIPSIDGQIIALVVPHAGLIYSGPIAAYSYKLLENSNVNTVILCGPSHRLGFDGVSVYGPGITWQTPLGDVKCDDSVCQTLLDYDGISVIPEAHINEHCLEVQLPYLQTVLKEFEIVPALIGYRNHDNIKRLEGALSRVTDDARTVMIASTDWQHYRPASQGWKLDSAGIDCIKRLDPDALESYLQQGRTEACGGAALVAVMRAAIAKGANRAKILKYGDSGDLTGDKSSVVGYAAAVIYKSDGKDTSNPTEPSGGETMKSDSSPKFELTDADRHLLLEIARTSIDCHLNKKPLPDYDVSQTLRDNGAAFVTLNKSGRLRGCIGYTMAFKPLWETVSECAVKAAVEDPRFPPVIAGELPELHIEISVLTPLERVKSLDEIKVGRDGLMISLGMQRGLLLPQVATDYGWTETEFLQQTCRKAGLPLDAYKSPNATIERFQAVIFEEE
ncbi:MAG: AmmeMemoRadiSam system protein B [Candidatus Zixiibacteriota bacterium]